MKAFKLLLISVSLLFIGGTYVNAASVTWIDYGFNYSVLQNAADVYTKSTDPANLNGYDGPTTVSGATPSFSKRPTFSGDPLGSSADSSASGGGDLGLELKGGTTGGHITDGVKQQAYLESSSAFNNGVPSGYGIEMGSGQQVTGYTVRRFELDKPGTFNITGHLVGGTIDATNVEVPNPDGFPVPITLTSATYEYSGGISLIQNVVDETSGFVTSASTIGTIDIQELLDNDGLVELEDLHLLTHLGGDKVSYDIKVQINLSSEIANFASFLTMMNPWLALPEGSLGTMGTELAPLDIEATLVSSVPVPGSGILLLSGLIGFIGYRNRVSKA